MSATVESNERPDYDKVIEDIADYVTGYEVKSDEAWDTARNCLMDTLGCGLLALRFPECSKHLGPLVEGTSVPNGLSLEEAKVLLECLYQSPKLAALEITEINPLIDQNNKMAKAALDIMRHLLK